MPDAVHTVTGRRQRYSKGSSDFFEAIRAHTVAAFLIDPESEYGGNRGGVGWKLIGRDPAHSFQPKVAYGSTTGLSNVYDLILRE